MQKKGKIVYVPRIVVEELDNIKREENLFGTSEAFRKMVGYAKVGKEVKTIRLPEVDLFTPIPKRYKVKK